jgi:hypothetical protein
LAAGGFFCVAARDLLADVGATDIEFSCIITCPNSVFVLFIQMNTNVF